MVIGLLALVAVPETVERSDPAWRYRPQRVAVPAASRTTFWGAGVAGFVAFAMFGFFTSLGPSFISQTLHHTSHALAGVVSFSVFGSAALFQILTARWRATTLYAAGLVALAVGLVLVVAAILAGSLVLLIAGSIVAGAGSGTTFKAAVAAVIAIAPAGRRGEALAGLYLIAYLGLALPVIMLGVLLEVAATDPSVIAFGAVMLLLLLAASAMLLGGRRGFAGRPGGYR
jgi:MFS family permease